jgi:hypothetical protein
MNPMKKLFALIALVSINLGIIAQAPQKISYQCVVRTTGGVLITNQSVGIRISILQGTSTGTVIYQETYNPVPQTNANGLLTIEIGGGISVTGTFSSINWASGQYFLKTEIDPAGGTNYTIVGVSQLLSVPYALDAKNAEYYSETDPVFTAWNKSDGISITSSQVSDFSASVTNNPAMVANTAKVTNATHTGDVTGAGALTIANKVTMTGTAPISVSGNPTVIATNPVAVSIAAATTSTAGSMSASDKSKLDGLSLVGITSLSTGGSSVTIASTSIPHGTVTEIMQMTGVPSGTWAVFCTCPVRNTSTSSAGLNIVWAITTNDANPSFPGDGIASSFIPATGWTLQYPFGQSIFKTVSLYSTGTIELKMSYWGTVVSGAVDVVGSPTMRAIKLF